MHIQNTQPFTHSYKLHKATSSKEKYIQYFLSCFFFFLSFSNITSIKQRWVSYHFNQLFKKQLHFQGYPNNSKVNERLYYIQCFPVYLVTYKNTCIATHLFAGYVVLPDNIWIKFRYKKKKRSYIPK